MGVGFRKLDIRGILLAAAAACACVLQFFSDDTRHARQPGSSGDSASRFSDRSSCGQRHHPVFPGGSVTGLGLAFLTGVGLIYVAAYLIHMSSLRFAPASTVAPFYNLEPMVTTAVAGLLLGERLATTQYAGGGMILAALVAAGFIPARKIARS